MTDPTAIIGTIDLITRRLADLRIRYKDWLSNPEQFQCLSLELDNFIQDLNNVKITLKNISSIDPHKAQELHHVIQSINSLFDKSKQDLDKLENIVPQHSQPNLPDTPSASVSVLQQQPDGHTQETNVNPNSTSQSSRNEPKDCGEAARVETKRFKHHTQKAAKNFKSFTRVKRDTEILKQVDDSLREGRNLLLHVSNFIHLQLTSNLAKRDTPKFIPHFDTPFQSESWVVDFTLTPSNQDPTTTPNNQPDAYSTTNRSINVPPSSSQPNILSQEAQVKQILLSCFTDTDQPMEPTHSISIPSICVYGQGGMGKSVALQSICYDKQIRDISYDGVHFLTVGQNATTQDVIQQFSLCARHAGYEKLSKEIMEMKSADEAAREVSIIFKGKRVLFVADDLWVSERSGTGFLREVKIMGGMSEGAILFSTRDESLGSEGREKVFFDFLETKGKESRMILERCVKKEKHRRRERTVFQNLDKEAKRALDMILQLCGGWKLCLAVAGGALSEDIRDCGNNVSLGLATYVNILREDEERMIHDTTADYHEHNLITIAESSVRRCKEWSEKRAIRRLCDGELGMEEMFRSLCVIEKQKWIGMRELCRMWGVSERYGETVVKQMGRMNLVSRKLERVEAQVTRLKERGQEDMEWVVRVHDRMIDVCVDLSEEKDDEGTKRWHKLILDRYIRKSDSKNIPECDREEEIDEEAKEDGAEWNDYKSIRNRGNCREWWDSKKMNGKYMMRNLARHLVRGGMWDELFYVLTDVRWTLRRQDEGGWSTLNDDYDKLIGVLNIDRLAKHKVSGIKILRNVLRDAWGDIRDEKHQVGFQVFGRFLHVDGQHEAVARYKLSIERYGPRPWLRPNMGVLRKRDEREAACLHPAGACRLTCLSLDGKYSITTGNLHPNSTRIFITNLVSQEVTYFDVQKRAEIICFDFCFETWQIAIGLKDGSIEVRDANTGTIVGEKILAHEGVVRSVSLNASGSRLVSAGTDKLLRIWDVSSSSCSISKLLDGHDDIVTCTAYSGNGKFLASGSYDNTLRIWDAETGLPIGRPLIGHDAIVTCVAFNEQGDYVVSGSADMSLHVWNINNNDTIGKKLTGHKDIVSCVAMNREGSLIISGSGDKTVRIWNAKTGQLVAEPLIGHSLVIRQVAFGVDDDHVLSVSSDQTIRTWNVRANTSNNCLMSDHEDWVKCVSFSRDGSLVASGSWDKTIRLWDGNTNQPTRTPLRGHELSVNCLAFNSAGTHIVSGSRDCSIRVWDIRKGFHVTKVLSGHVAIILWATFCRNESFVVSGSVDTTIRVWNIASEKPVGQPLYLSRVGVETFEGSRNDLAYFQGWLHEKVMLLGAVSRDHLARVCLNALEENRNLIDKPLTIGIEDLNCLTSRDIAGSTTEPLTKEELGIQKLVADTSSVSFSGDRKLKIADIRSGTAFAVYKNRTAHGLRDGRVMICNLES